MRKLGILAAFVFAFVPAVNADILNSALPSAPGSGGGMGPYLDEYQLDDGASENSVGLTSGGELAWMNTFTVNPGEDVITDISVTFGTPQFPGSSGIQPGDTVHLYLWSGTPTGTYNLLWEGSGTVDASAIELDQLQHFAVPNVDVGDPGDPFFFGVSINHSAGFYPASLDQTIPPGPGRSYVCGSNTPDGFDPNNLNGGIGLYDVNDLFPGAWLVRASAIPEPGSLLLLGLGVLALRRR